MRTSTTLLISISVLFLSVTSFAEVMSFPVVGFTFKQSVTVVGKPGPVFDEFTGDVKAWWDHSFTDDPVALVIEPRPGGMFYEYFDAQGNGVRHATVISADRGHLLRLDGPLGLTGRALDFVSTITFEPAGEDSTQLLLTVNMTGQIDSSLAATVERVWTHFLIERFKPYVEGTLEE